MSLATVHYLSMNTRNAGASAFASTPANTVSATFNITGANPSQVLRINWGDGTETVTNKVLTSNVATLTIGSHVFKVGDVVTVSGFTSTDIPLNGTWTLTGVAATTISYADTATNIGTGAPVGPGVVTGYTPVTADANGAASKTVTYPTAGARTVVVTDNTTGQVVDSTTVTVT